MAFIGLVPARGGSKGIPGKNIAPCGGKPLLAWTAEAAFASGVLDRVILSTDDEEIAKVGRQLRLEVPFLRPSSLAADDTTMLAVMAHALQYLRAEGGTTVDALVLLQPTSPFRRGHHIAEAIEMFRARRPATLVSIGQVPHRFVPSSLMRTDDGCLVALDGGDIGSPLRQGKEKLFARNGPAILIVSPSEVDAGRIYGRPTIGYEMGEIDSLDIDAPEDLRLADHLLRTGWR